MILSIPPDTSTRSTIATRTHSQRVVTDRLAQLPDNISNSLPDRLKLEGEKARRSSSPDSLPLSGMSSTFHLCLHGVSQATVPQDWFMPLWCSFHLEFEISASPTFYTGFSQILLFFTFCKTQSPWEVLDDSRKETKLYFLVLFIFGNSFFGQSTNEFKWK